MINNNKHTAKIYIFVINKISDQAILLRLTFEIENDVKIVNHYKM